MRRWVLGIVLLALLVVSALAVPVQAQGTGILEGRVVNGTSGGAEVGAGISVTLHVFRGDAEVDTLETTTGSEGVFRFEELNTDPELEYWLEAVYLDVFYNSAAPYQFDADGTTLDATVTVFETTDDDGAVRLDSVHIIAESFGEVLRISEIHLFGNSGDRAYAGRDGQTVYVPLPGDAVGLAFQESVADGRFVEVDGGFVDSEPVLPGPDTSLVFFSYHLMAPGETVPLERRFAYPVTDLNVLVSQPGLTLNSEQLQVMGTESFQGQQYEFYVVQDLEPGAPLVMELVPVPDAAGGTGMPEAPPEGGQAVAGGAVRGNQELLRWLGFGLVVLAVIGVVVYAALSRPSVAAPAPATRLASNPEARRTLADLADLEEAYEAGQVDETAYERRRAELYESLKAL